jgi:hypothetical protein
MDDPWIMVLHTEHKSSAFREIKLKGFKRRENIWRSSWIEEHISAHEEWLFFLIALNIHQILVDFDCNAGTSYIASGKPRALLPLWRSARIYLCILNL